MPKMSLGGGTALLLQRLRRRERGTRDEVHLELLDQRAESTWRPTEPSRSRRYLALKRILNADCPSCRGFGCETCAGTGIA
jgi:hypothetical protein